jgi:hypothetical protein
MTLQLGRTQLIKLCVNCGARRWEFDKQTSYDIGFCREKCKDEFAQMTYVYNSENDLNPGEFINAGKLVIEDNPIFTENERLIISKSKIDTFLFSLWMELLEDQKKGKRFLRFAYIKSFDKYKEVIKGGDEMIFQERIATKIFWRFYYLKLISSSEMFSREDEIIDT